MEKPIFGDDDSGSFIGAKNSDNVSGLERHLKDIRSVPTEMMALSDEILTFPEANFEPIRGPRDGAIIVTHHINSSVCM